MTEEKILEALKILAAKLGVAAEHLYGVLVRQGFIEGIYFLSCAVICGIVLILLSRYLNKFPWANAWKDADPAIFSVLMFASIPAVVAIIGFFHSLDGALTGLFNPEYSAITEILKVIK